MEATKKSDRQYAIEQILGILFHPEKPFYRNVLVVSSDRETSAVFFDEVRSACEKTGFDYVASLSSLTIWVGLRTAHFRSASDPENLAGFNRPDLLVLQQLGSFPPAAQAVVRSYDGFATMVAFSD